MPPARRSCHPRYTSSYRFRRIPAVAPQILRLPNCLASRLRLSPFQFAALALVVLRCHQESKRHLEGVVGLITVQPKHKARLHARQHGHDTITEGSYVDVKIADGLDKAAAKRDLLLGLTQRGCRRAFVPDINLSAWELNLSRVVGKMCGALSE